MEQKNISTDLEKFLEFLREVKEKTNIALTIESEKEAETQDILHNIELSEHGYHEYAKLSKKLRDIRQDRRKAKNIIEISSPIVDWTENNKQVIKSLEKLLGELRKIEKTIESRQYGNRTNVLDEFEENK